MHLLWRNPRIRNRPGTLTGCFCVGYGVLRMVGELFREPDAFIGFLSGGTTMGQWLSLPMVLAGLYFIWRAKPIATSALIMSAAPGRTHPSVCGRALRERIRRDGPIPLADVMAAVDGGLLTTAAATGVSGRAGDFITAPDISQVFGELIGLWCAVVWERMGHPSSFRLVEFGPGRGALMADALRAVARVPGFMDAADIHLVERSASLRAAQRQAVIRPSRDHVARRGIGTMSRAGPIIVIANEFADALPIQQFVRADDGWNASAMWD